MKYYITHNTVKGLSKIIDRIRDIGDKAYIYYNCIPKRIVKLIEKYEEFDKGKEFVIFENYNDHEIDYYRFLGFGFEGLYTDEEKIKVLEEFGKYGCVVYEENEIDFPQNVIQEREFYF